MLLNRASVKFVTNMHCWQLIYLFLKFGTQHIRDLINMLTSTLIPIFYSAF